VNGGSKANIEVSHEHKCKEVKKNGMRYRYREQEDNDRLQSK